VNDLSGHIIFKKRALWHLLFWIVATGYLMLAFRGRSDSYWEIFISTLRYLPAHVFFVYAAMYFLLPQLLFKKKYFLFSIFLVAILILCSLYVRFIDTVIYHSVEGIGDRRIFFRAIFGNLNLCGIAVAIKLFKSWYLEREAKQQAEKAELLSQLQLLKSQIHPHFLFNTLNNLYSLTRENSPESSMVVLKLSSLLRYMLYECNKNEISLENEIEMLRNYIGLEQIRYGKRLEFSLNISGNTKGKLVAPLLLLPFLENCFKHGASKQLDHCWINMDLSAEENTLYLLLTNGNVNTNDRPPATEGIGLSNVRKRLNLLYPKAHHLKLIPGEDTFTVSLQLELKSLERIEQMI
jgi:sensor histidine kinase YesM